MLSDIISMISAFVSSLIATLTEMAPTFGVFADIATIVGIAGVAVGALAVLAGVACLLIVILQLYLLHRVSQNKFESALCREYRSLGGGNPESKADAYNCLDLCNEQTYLRRTFRVSRSRWKDWRSGIERNLSSSAFADAWREAKQKGADNFSHLQRLEQKGFDTDPAFWLFFDCLGKIKIKRKKKK